MFVYNIMQHTNSRNCMINHVPMLLKLYLCLNNYLCNLKEMKNKYELALKL